MTLAAEAAAGAASAAVDAAALPHAAEAELDDADEAAREADKEQLNKLAEMLMALEPAAEHRSPFETLPIYTDEDKGEDEEEGDKTDGDDDEADARREGWKKLDVERGSLRSVTSPGSAAVAPGGLVVHTEHGRGRYLGLRQIRVKGEVRVREYLELEYAGDEKMYLPLDQEDQLQRYDGSARDVADLS